MRSSFISRLIATTLIRPSIGRMARTRRSTDSIEPRVRTSLKRKQSLKAAQEKAAPVQPDAEQSPSNPGSGDDVVEKKPKAAKAAKVKTPTVPLDPEAATNLTMPHSLHYEPASPGEIKLVTWNISGYAASMKKGFRLYVEGGSSERASEASAGGVY